MTETQKRIEAYKKALPEIRERVIAVALLFAMSMAMMTSATFAWLTISRAPEVTAVSTTVAANGNLEIALATTDEAGKTNPPGESKVGDSSAAEGQSVTAANITWGNLVNLSDPSYGLEHLALRPAQLNTAALLVSPLYGAQYAGDGRVTQLDSSFAYTVWKEAEGDEPANFAVSDKLGVRAISSTKMETQGAEAAYYRMVTAAKNKNLEAANMYANLGNNKAYMQSLATMMGLFMTAKMNPSEASLNNPTINAEDVQNLRDMYGAFLEAFDTEADAMASLLNLQLFLKHGEGSYTPYTAEMVYASTEAKLSEAGLKITGLNQFVKDRNIIASDYEKLVNICSSGTSLKWNDSGIVGIVNNLVDVGKCTIGADNTPINNIGASNAMGYLSGTQEARITNGILYRFEERTGGYISVKNLSISATVKRAGITVPATVKANIQTTAPRDYNLFTNDLTYTESLNTGEYEGGTAVAKETYGLAIDLWVRTNAGTQINNANEETISGSYLTLEGNLLTESEMVRATGKDANGNTVELYTVKISVTDTDGSVISSDLTVYGVTAGEGDNEVTTWYDAENHSEVTAEEMGNNQPMAKMVEKITVTGYEGENRVWTDSTLLSVDATTQGSGSCYVYYADTPEDQARSLKLLEAFNVAFVDAKGKLLATAIMDTANHYAASGRVIVPLVLDPSNSMDLGEDEHGNINYAITALEKNVPTRITAIVYLDGTKLTNQEVLAASEIQGQLNIQFGSSENMNPIKNEELESEERRVSAEVSRTSFDYDTATEPMTTTVTVHVDGDEPEKVTAFFLRQISSTQGSREETMTFTKNAEGDWTADYTFTAPGTYVLRTVRLDGVDYDLPPDNIPTVTVNGFAIRSLTCTPSENRHIRVLTADNSSSFEVNLQFATSDGSKLPRTVQARFLKDDDGSAVNVELKPDATGIWKGTGTFLTSGTYTMQYVVLDGKYVELDSGLWHTADITLGMRVAVYTTSPHLIIDDGEIPEENERLLGMQVKIMDDTGEDLPGFTGAKLVYRLKGGSINDIMDTDLTWNGEQYQYEGELLNSFDPGVWQFSNVTVGSNTLTVATTAPQFTIRSVSPSNYHSHSTSAYQYAPDNDATMNAYITNTAGLANEENEESLVKAFIVKQGQSETSGVWVDGSFIHRDESVGKATGVWKFTVPTDRSSGYQDGTWQMIKLSLGEVYDSEGNYYPADAPLIIDISDKNNVTTVVNRIKVAFPDEYSQGNIELGKDAEGNVTGTFMQEHSISNLGLKITDNNGNALGEGVNISDVYLMFTYKTGSSGGYGGYTSDELTNASEGAKVTVKMAKNGEGVFVPESGQEPKLVYAGEYYSGLFFKVNGTAYAYGDVNGDGKEDTATVNIGGTLSTVKEKSMVTGTPVFSVWSNKPSVTITGVSPAATETFSTTKTNGSVVVEVSGVSNFVSAQKDYAIVYMKAAKSALGNWGYTVPTVTLKLDGMAAFDTATLTMVNEADPNTTHVFSFTPSKKEVTQSIGKSVGRSGGHDTKYLAGKVDFTEIPVTYNNMEFVVELARTVTIEQMEAPFVLSFANVPNAVPDEDRPTQVTANGSEVTVHLPRLTWTETSAADPVYTKWTDWSKTKDIRTDYSTYSQKILWATYTRYDYYIWTEYSRTRSVTGETMAQNKVIDGWIINGLVYPAGTTFTISLTGDTTATAVIKNDGAAYSLGQVTTEEKEYQYGYVAGKTEQENTPNGGMQLGSASGLSSAPAPKLYKDEYAYTDINGYRAAWPQ